MSSSVRRLGIERRPAAGPFKPEFLVAEAVANASSLGEMASLLSEYAEILNGLAADGWELDDRRGDDGHLYLVDEGGFGTRESWNLALDDAAAHMREERLRCQREQDRLAEERFERWDGSLSGVRVAEVLAAHPGVEWVTERNPGLDPATRSEYSKKVVWWRATECGHEYQWDIQTQCIVLTPRTESWRRVDRPVCRVCLAEIEKLEQAARDRRTWFKTAPLVEYWPEVSEWWDTARNTTRPEDHIAYDTTHVWWTHPICGHLFTGSVRSFRPKGNCPVCEDRQTLAGFNDLITRYPSLSAIVTEAANVGRDLATLPAWGATKVGWQCEACKELHEATSYRLTKTPLPSCKSCTLSGTSAVEIALRDALATRAHVEPGEATLPVAWGSRKTSRVDITGTHDGARFVVEYDGQRWHTVKTAQDLAKTEALLDAGYIVIRVRENTLHHLPITNPALAQVTHRYGADIDSLADTVLAGIARLRDQLDVGSESAA